MDDKQYQHNSLFSIPGSSTGFTPFMNGAMLDANPFDAQYAMHSMAMSGSSNTGAFHDGMEDFTGNTFDPSVLGRTSSSSSSNSNNSGSPANTKHRRITKRSASATSPEDEESFDMTDPNNSHKRAKFLERNRLAAAKCRTKKKQWTNNLEAAARQASQQTRELQAIVQSLRDQVLECKTQLLVHQGCDCHQIQRYLMNEQNTNGHSSFSCPEGQAMGDGHGQHAHGTHGQVQPEE